MRRVYFLARKELGTYFSSPMAYIILTFYLLLTGFFFYSNLNTYAANEMPAHYEDTFSILAFITVLVTPLITMRLLAEETNKGTIETLLSTPLSDFEIVFAKFLSSVTFYVFLLMPTLLHIIIMAKYTSVDIPSVMSGYLGLVLTAASLFSIGILISALCSNQITAGIITMVVSFLLIFASAATANLPRGSILADVLFRISLIQNSDPYVRGVIDTRTIVYFLSVIIACLYITTKVISSRLWRVRKFFMFPLIIVVVLYNGVILNVISYAQYMRIDVTKEKRFELSEKSKLILRTIDRKVKVYIVPIGDPTVDRSRIHAWMRFRDFMREAQQHSKYLVYEEIDDKDVIQMNEIKDIFGELPEMGKIYIIIDDEDKKNVKKQFTYFHEMFSGDPYTGKIVKFFAESKILGAIKKLLYKGIRSVYFTVGHKEFPTELRHPVGLGRMFQYFNMLENVAWKALNLMSVRGIPQDCELLCVFGAHDDFRKEEIEVLEDYLSKGGRLLITLTPNDLAQPLYNLDTFLSKYGLLVNRARIYNRNLSEYIALGVLFPEHSVNIGMQESQLYFPNSCSLEENLKASRDFKRYPLVKSDQFSTVVFKKFIRETGTYEFFTGDEGTRNLIMVSEPVILDPEETPLSRRFRLVVIASTEAFTTNALRLYAIEGGTILPFHYFDNLFKWMTEREEEIIAAPKSFEDKPLVLTAQDKNFLFITAIICMPLIGVISGLVTYFRRRK